MDILEHLFALPVLFMDEARFFRDGIISIHKPHQWGEENPHGIISYKYQ
jgi:hypothetical protein